ncbi:MAG: CpaF family protein, partial [Clostridia bacterium]|nr:CpaF family protein [Clostridia bacterium]
TVLMSGMELPVSAIRQQCVGAFDLIVHTERLRDGTRKIMSITEVGTMVGEIVSLQEIFRFVHDGESVDRETGKKKVLGHFEATGVQPNCCQKMQDNGAVIRQEWFRTGKRR